MLEFCGRKFTCDECPICEGIEHRLRVAREGGYEPQLEYCGCDKVQTEFFISGYCSDEMYSCYECPASKPEYLKRKSREPQRLQAIGNLHDVAKQILDDEVVILLRQYGTTLAPGRMGDESRVPKWLLVLAADRIEELKNARTKQ